MQSTSHLARIWQHKSPQTSAQVPLIQGRLLAVILAAATLCLSCPGPATAGVVYDNISGASGAVSGGSAGIATTNAPLANSFSTGGQSTLLTDVGLLLRALNPASGGSFSVSLLSDNSTSPGVTLTTIATVNDSLLAATLGTFSYQLPTPYPLAAHTRYWIELDSPSSTSEWSFTATNVGIGVDNEYVYYAGQVFANSAFTPYQMTVTTVVPEPTTIGLCALGLLVIAAARRVRARL
jgi:PEP-CTERM putative exosortase interaction domain